MQKLPVPKTLKLFCEHESLDISENETLTKANRNTIKVRLREFVNDKHIEQHGKARATWHSLAKQWFY